MVVCKYYRQGNCRYGQYCQYVHVNNFGGGNKLENYSEDEITALIIAKEVLVAERGGQWLLSCFAPWKERPCIPGMDDLSPEEVRWEMYQAQKHGMVTQAKQRFQQLCQDMKAKREVLKNPSHETVAMLKRVVGKGQKPGTAASKSSAFSFATPQLSLPSSTAASNVFGGSNNSSSSTTFATQSNPFGGAFTASSSASLFGRTNTSTAPVFGGTATFGTGLGFGGAASSGSGSVFGGAKSAAMFPGVQGATGATAPQSGSVFGGSGQPMFGQASAFGASGQAGNVFARPQMGQPTPVFDGGTTSSNPLFGAPITSQAGGSSSVFGGASKAPAASLFGGSTPSAAPAFGTVTSTAGNLASAGSSSMFGQAKTAPAFGGAPVFGAVSSFGGATAPMFGGQPTFGGQTAAVPATSIFGASAGVASTFGAAQTTGTFGATNSTAATSVFGTAQSAPASVATPFGSGTATSSVATPFVAAGSQFGAATSGTGSSSDPFARPTFGLLSSGAGGSTFGTTVTSSAPYGATVSSSAPFASPLAGTGFGAGAGTAAPFSAAAFGAMQTSAFAGTATTAGGNCGATEAASNPFAPRTQQQTGPFGSVNSSTTSSNPFAANGSITAIVDDSVYSAEGLLTDDEKSMYLAERFVLGKIPLKPPTKDIR